MPTPPIADKLLVEAWNALQDAPNKQAAANTLKIPVTTLSHRLNTYKMRFPNGATSKPEFTVSNLPDDDIDIDELVEHRIKQFEKKKRHQEATKLIPIKVHIPGVIGILHFGDPHVDDDGTDLDAIRQHGDLTHQEGIWGANVGDTTNNWVGRLARLYAHQSTSADQAWKLAEWFIQRTRWLYMIGGNHDAWSGSSDPIKWISKQSNTLYQSSECRIGLRFPNKREIIVNARHDFAGHSQWNPTHGQMKAAQMGMRDHIMISGHKHTSGYGLIKDPSTGKVCHAIQVASYKIFDSYAKERGFRDQSLSPACMTVINPDLPQDHPDMVKVFWDPFEGADFVKWKRNKK
jgi:hypothetical protein